MVDNTLNWRKPDNIGGANKNPDEADGVAPADRERKVLEFIAEHGFPMPPIVIYRGMRFREDVTFGYSATKDIIERLVDFGELMPVEKDPIEHREIVELPQDTDARAYYWITDKGRERVGAAE